MTSAPLPDQEYARLLALSHYEILDTPAEAAFDRATRLAAHLLRTPVAFINFVDQYRQWSKAVVGITDTHGPRSDSFCAWTILQDTPLVIEDAHLDPRFASNPFVTGEPHIHMYAGAPLIMPSGQCIGTICVTDHQPHPLTAADLAALQDLAAVVVNELELRLRTRRQDRELNAQTQQAEELRRTLDQARVLEGVTSLMDLELSPAEITLSAAGLLGEALASDYTGLMLFEGEVLRVEAAYVHPRLPPEAAALPKTLPQWPGSVTQSLRDLTQPLYLDDYSAHPNAVSAVVAAGIRQIAWLPLGTRNGVISLLMTVRLQDNAVPGWRSSDRALLEAAGRTVSSALDRRLVSDAAAEQIRRDPLTGSLNRRALEQDLQAWQQQGVIFSLAVLDLDGLKGVNDEEGHAQGDKVLQVFAGTLAIELGGLGRIYRIGGDEFIVLTNGLSEDELHELVDIALLAGKQVAPVRGISVGVAHSFEAEGTALIALADTRMYEVKRRRQTLRTAPLERAELRHRAQDLSSTLDA
ncbi:diguanylate cyclase domain-containing protein [Deinococcus oregonensis]|uniref:Diguanylate cyclase domain-containing protein n=1 Tax=Deinococcus oregonensis TaxID=1805970 RepID=A0ABV6B3A4_9DEIO